MLTVTEFTGVDYSRNSEVLAADAAVVVALLGTVAIVVIIVVVVAIALPVFMEINRVQSGQLELPAGKKLHLLGRTYNEMPVPSTHWPNSPPTSCNIG